MAELVDSFVKLLLPFDGVDGAIADIDHSGNNHVLTFVNNAQLDSAQKVFGPTSLLLDGTGDHVTVPDNAEWAFATSDFTVDFRVRWNSSVATTVFWSQGAGTPTNRQSMFLEANVLYYQVYSASSAIITITNAWTPSADTWYHVGLVKSGNSYYMFVDGTQVGSTDSDISPVPDLSGVFSIGAETDGDFSLNGWIDEFRVSKGVARWIANFTPPSYPYHRIARIQNL